MFPAGTPPKENHESPSASTICSKFLGFLSGKRSVMSPGRITLTNIGVSRRVCERTAYPTRPYRSHTDCVIHVRFISFVCISACLRHVHLARRLRGKPDDECR